MLWGIAIVLVLLLIFGSDAAQAMTFGGYIHFLVVIALALLLVRVLENKRV